MPPRHGMPFQARDNVLADAVKGAAAGAIGVWVMDRVDWYMYDHEDAEARRRTQQVRPGGLDPAHVVANKVASAFGTELSPRQPHPAGVAVHYAIGIGPAALYGALQDRVPAFGTGRGALYGLGLFLIQDELVNSATGLSARPGQYPWQVHARGLVAHLVFGIITDTVFRLLKGSGGRRLRAREAADFTTRRSRPEQPRSETRPLNREYRPGSPPVERGWWRARSQTYPQSIFR